MIGLEDRQTMVRHIDTAHAAGARLRPACELAGITVRTLQRWKAEDGLQVGDRRPQADRPTPAHALTEEERARILVVANAAQRHAQEDQVILAARHQIYLQARERHPARWSRGTRDWTPVGAVTLNPERDAVIREHEDAENIQRSVA